MNSTENLTVLILLYIVSGSIFIKCTMVSMFNIIVMLPIFFCRDKIHSLCYHYHYHQKMDAAGHFIFKTLPQCHSRVPYVSNLRQCIE